MNCRTPRIRLGLRLILAITSAATSSVCALQQTAVAQNAFLTTLHSFSGSDGSTPAYGPLTQGSDGNFYGTTWIGGSTNVNGGSGLGTVFKVTPSGALTTLYEFTGPDGDEPYAGVVQGSDGNFYGTTSGGGANYDGTVFCITPAGSLTTLHSFSGADGQYPQAALVQGTDGNFYGTTQFGGANGDGAIFQITPSGTFTLLHSFSRTDGEDILAALVQGSDGNFYGVAQNGGANNDGVVFKMTPSGAFTTLHSFSGTDGQNPLGGLTQASDGNFYGTTYAGGTTGLGVVFSITPSGNLTTLHSFIGSDGASPEARLVQGTDGNLYGTTNGGGTNKAGTAFEITTSGLLTSLHSFTGSDGSGLTAGLVQGTDGNFYGTAQYGGNLGLNGGLGGGTVFVLKSSALVSAPSRIDEVYDSTRGILYITNGSSVVRYQTITGTYLTPLQFSGANLMGIDISPDNNTLAIADSVNDANGQPTIHLVNLNSLAATTVSFPLTSDIDTPSGTYSVSFADNGTLLVSEGGYNWGPLRLYNPSNGTTINITPLANSYIRQNSMLCASADRSTIAVAEAHDSGGPFGRFRVADMNWQEISNGTGWYNYEIGVNSTGTQFAIPTYGGTFFYDANLLLTGPTIGVYASGQPEGVVYSPNSNLVYFPWEGTPYVYAYDSTTFSQVNAYNFGDTFTEFNNQAYYDGRMKISKSGTLLFGSVTGGVEAVGIGSSPVDIDTVSPRTVPAGASDTTVTINGQGFTSSSIVEYNGAGLSTTFVSSQQLRAVIPAAYLTQPSNVEVTVVTGSANSNPLRLYITLPAPTGLATTVHIP